MFPCFFAFMKNSANRGSKKGKFLAVWSSSEGLVFHWAISFSLMSKTVNLIKGFYTAIVIADKLPT